MHCCDAFLTPHASAATTAKEALLVGTLCNKVSALVVVMSLQDKLKSLNTARTVYGHDLSMEKLFHAMSADKFPFYGNSVGSVKHTNAMLGKWFSLRLQYCMLF
jgi:hypothetical protein